MTTQVQIDERQPGRVGLLTVQKCKNGPYIGRPAHQQKPKLLLDEHVSLRYASLLKTPIRVSTAVEA